MISYNRLTSQLRRFLALTGLTLSEFEAVLPAVELHCPGKAQCSRRNSLCGNNLLVDIVSAHIWGEDVSKLLHHYDLRPQ
jgi:hypothetical protein